MRGLSWRALLAAAFISVLLPAQSWAAEKSLEETLKFVRDTWASEGLINYTIQAHDWADGGDWSETMGGEASEIAYDTAECSLSFRWRTWHNGEPKQNLNLSHNFRDGKSTFIMTREAEIREQSMETGNTWQAIVSPFFWVVTVRFAESSLVANFTSRNKAVRFSRAVEHAMDLCGATRDSF